ncbi:glycosyltransferase [Nostoc sp. CALU 1950]|uniref:glycosyltransferase n=1 Tax=Nostoc sp. CALU 1950 TaxID=3104321 RepID=UPI003EBABD3F
MPNNTLSHLTTSINSLLKKVVNRINYIKGLKIVSLKPNQPSRGNVLFSYRIEPFLLKAGQPIPHDHTWYWEVWRMVQTFLDLGYNVDVIQFYNDEFVPEKHYSFFIDVRHRMQELAPKLNKDCVKIFHVDIANMVFRNAAECHRHLELQQRRGITLCPQRYEVPNLGIEYADYGIVLGNEFTINTFKYANKPIYRVPLSNPTVYPWPEQKDFEAVRKHFLWFASHGFVHKGLDLVLEAFAQMPDFHLTVCGPIKQEPEFEQAFYQELYETPNIHTYGWIDVTSPEFIEVTNSCIGTVLVSAAEGGAGSVITCMHTGLIPIVNYETSVNVHENYGVLLNNSSIAEIQAAVRRISNLPIEDLKSMSRKAWEYVRANHTKENFAQVYRNTIEQIIENHSQKKQTSSKQLVSSDASGGLRLR